MPTFPNQCPHLLEKYWPIVTHFQTDVSQALVDLKPLFPQYETDDHFLLLYGAAVLNEKKDEGETLLKRVYQRSESREHRFWACMHLAWEIQDPFLHLRNAWHHIFVSPHAWHYCFYTLVKLDYYAAQPLLFDLEQEEETWMG